MVSWPSSVILVIRNALFSDTVNSVISFPFLISLNVTKLFFLLVPWIIVLVLAVHPEKKIIGFGLCICEVKGRTRSLSRLPSTRPLLVIRGHSCVPSAWPPFRHWLVTRSRFPDSPSIFPFQGENLSYAVFVSRFSVKESVPTELFFLRWELGWP